MKALNYLGIIMLLIMVVSCGSNSGKNNNQFRIMTNAVKGNLSIKDNLKLSLQNKKNHQVDSVVYTLNGVRINDDFPLKNHKLGKHTIEATVFFNNETQTINTSLTVLNDAPPKIFSYEIVNEYPHDITSYTQGLEFYNGNLYESTGQKKESKLRQVNYKTGEVIKNINLADAYFGEGITILENKIYQLTWQAGTGFIYDVNTLEKTGSFKYGKSKEGWGLAHFKNTIYKSDGTQNIWMLNPETLVEEDNIQVYTNKGKIVGINEMEWIDGNIYANRYQKDGVAIINPENGAVVGVIDFTPLKKKVKQHAGLDVLNGIAFNPETNTIFVTGKRWDKLFEVRIKE